MDPDASASIPSAPAPLDAVEMPKYIRTYASDVAIVERGGTPDLAPMNEASPTRDEMNTPPPGALRFGEAPDAAFEQASQERTDALERLRERARVLNLPTDREPAPPLPEAPPSSSDLHTYEGDLSARVRDSGASAASILAAQADAPRSASAATQDKGASARNWKPALAGVLVLLGIGGLYFGYAKYAARTGPVALAPVAQAPIFVDEREALSGTGSFLMLALSQAVGRPLPNGQVRLLYDPAATTSSESVFNELLLPAPDMLLRNIDAAGSMAGVVSVAGVQSPFFILEVASYGDTFAGMLSWEPSMLQSLARLFPPYPAATASAAATAATATSSVKGRTQPLQNPITPPPVDQGFIDQVVANHDARIYRDSTGKSVLIYGYWNQTTLVIARDEASFSAILGRLATSRSQ